MGPTPHRDARARKKFTVAPAIFKCAQHGRSGEWLRRLMPNTAKIADDFASQRNADGGDQSRTRNQPCAKRGSQLAGRAEHAGRGSPTGLGQSANEDLPAFLVFCSGAEGPDQPL